MENEIRDAVERVPTGTFVDLMPLRFGSAILLTSAASSKQAQIAGQTSLVAGGRLNFPAIGRRLDNLYEVAISFRDADRFSRRRAGIG
jgi:hypothetical protein